jgi:hypothetical protein
MSASLPVERMLAPSVETITAAGDALRDAAADVSVAGRTILETCQKVSAVMKALGLDGPSEGSSFGTVSIAIKAVVTSASKYVDAKTGISLREWADFVSTARTRFDDYLGQLDKVAAIATRYESADAALDPDHLRADRRIIEDAQFQTKLWRPIMSRLPQLSHLVDAIVASKKAPRTESADGKAGWRGQLNSFVARVKGRVANEHAEILRSLLGPVTDLRHRITTLHRDVEKMSECMFEFEDLLELQRTQIQMLVGEIDRRQIEVLSQRITIAVLFPRLKKRLAESRKSADQYLAFLQRLEAARANAGLSENVYASLAAEYRAGGDAAAASISSLEAEMAGWRTRGRDVLNANQKWLEAEREAVTAREMVGQIAGDRAREQLAGIARELRRTEAARWLVAEELARAS